MLEGARSSEDEFKASEVSLVTQGDGKRMKTPRDAYPTEPRIVVACSRVGVQSGIIGIGRPAIRNRRQAAHEKCWEYNGKHSERVCAGNTNA